MAIRTIFVKRMKKFIQGGDSWKGAAPYAKQITSRKSYPPASKPGTPPAVRTGDLTGYIRGPVNAFGDTVEGRVYSTAAHDGPYPSFMETGTSHHGPRPWLRPTMEEAKKHIKEDLLGGFNKKEKSQIMNEMTQQAGFKDNEYVLEINIAL